MKTVHTLILGLGLLTACLPDDVTDGLPVDSDVEDTSDTADTGRDTDDTGDTEDEAPSIHGSWRSKGGDLAPLLVQYFGFTTVDAQFKANSNYSVSADADDGKTYDFAGTYVVSGEGPIHRIVLTQTSPSSATAEGIFRVQGDTLTYEVVQTQPDFGFTPPTPATGFGSTGGDGVEPDANTQVYRRL